MNISRNIFLGVEIECFITAFPRCGEEIQRLNISESHFLGVKRLNISRKYFPGVERLDNSEKLFPGVERLNISKKYFPGVERLNISDIANKLISGVRA